ncbi:TIR domain-containing protein [Roseobacter sp. YSTF-M11]|uniref:TIR domain-containing protein n=1 Tax=Roseobacter insulae TaxID=2859783 RepID=A0A9X1FT40_9RHOB|nr:TIR domain-containing protein [Roseobacter insulae]MBW4707255.1 TIR domain-containing protein [Roseobacter insulae]
MARLFISHSSEDTAAARKISEWLSAEGWDDHFLDLDPERGIKAGERWQQSLRAAQNRCEAVLLLLSPAWAASRWCETEFLVASQLNKQIIGAIVAPMEMDDLPRTLTAEWHIVNLVGDDGFSQEGLARLRTGIAELGIDSWHFKWPPDHDPQRPIYPGLRPLEEDDAGIFFGRDGQILQALDRLRGLRRAGSGQFIIQGASGSGKSSFLKAGLVCRLERERDVQAVVPTMRFGRAAITGRTGLANALVASFSQAGVKRSAREMQERLLAGALAEELRALQRLRPPGALILPIDQAEELLEPDNSEAATVLQGLSDAAMHNDLNVVTIMAIRSDRWEELQSHPVFSKLDHEVFSLPPLPLGSYADVIRRPLERLEGSGRAVDFEEQLIDRLLSDIADGGSSDGLPLLAFTLERLWHDFAASGRITLENYETTGGISGAINAAVEQALTLADQDRAIPLDRQAKIALLRRGFIPWLAGIDVDTGRPVRNIALASEIPQEARPIIELMADQRLLIRDVDGETGEATFEPTHEAILRQWTLVGDWLGEQIQDFVTIDGIKRAARDWRANDRDPAWLTHDDMRLALALTSAEGEHGKRLTRNERDYLEAASEVWDARVRRRKRAVRLRIAAGGATLAATAAAAVVLWVFWQDAERAEQKTFAALKAAEARSFLDRGLPERALQQARAGYHADPSEASRSAYLTAILAIPGSLDFALDMGPDGPVALAWQGDETLVLGQRDGTLSKVDYATGLVTADFQNLAPRQAPLNGSEVQLRALDAQDGAIAGLFGDSAVRKMARDGTIEDIRTGTQQVLFLKSFEDAVFDRTQRVFGVGGALGQVSVWDCREPRCSHHTYAATALDIGPDDARAALVRDGNLWVVPPGGELRAPVFQSAVPGPGGIADVKWSDDGTVLRILQSDGRLFDLQADTLAVAEAGRAPAGPDGRIKRFVGPGAPAWVTCFGSRICRTGTDHIMPSVVPAGLGASPVPGVLTGTAPGAAWSPGKLATLSENAWIRIWKTAAADLDILPQEPVRVMAVDPATGGIYLGLRNNDIYRVAPGSSPSRVHAAAGGYFQDLTDLSIGPDGTIASLGTQQGLHVIRDGAVETLMPDHSGASRHMAWLGAGSLALMPTGDDRIVLLDLKVPDAPRLTAPLVETPWSAVVHPDGQHLIVSTTDGAIRRIDLATGLETAPLVTPERANSYPQSLALGASTLSISADATRIIAARGDAHVVVYDLQTGDTVWQREMPGSTANRVAFAPEGQMLAVLAADGTLAVWDSAVPDPEPWITVKPGGTGLVPTDIAWLDAHRLVVQSHETGFQLIDMRPEIWEARAQSVLRGLSGRAE